MVAAESPFSKYDLTGRISERLDSHLILPMLDFLLKHQVPLPRLRSPVKSHLPMPNRQIYPKKDLLQTKYELLKETQMVDFCCDVYKELNGADAALPSGTLPLSLFSSKIQ